MPSPPSAAKKQPLTLAQLSSYDDILTDALVDHTFYWTTIPKNRPSYHPSRGVKEEEITNIVQNHLIVEPDTELAESKLLATEGLHKFYNGLKTQKEKDDFRAHLRRYMQIYLPDSPFEVSSTNRYTIFSHEAAVTARKFVRRGQPVKYLSGIQVMITDKEDKELSKRKKDFSIVVSSRNKCAALFMGPARFANHDCGANARLMITGQTGIEIVATQNIEEGDEITVSYADNYFGEDNCECLCKTCEDNVANGWAQPEGSIAVKKSIEETVAEGYSLRRRRRDDSCASASPTPSVTPDIRPRVRKSKSKTLKVDSDRTSQAGSPAPRSLLRQKRKREFDSLQTPPVTPSKKLKALQYEVEPITTPENISRPSSDNKSTSAHSPSDSESAEPIMTDATTPEEDVKEPVLQSPPAKAEAPTLKQEESDTSPLSEIASTSPVSEMDASTHVAPVLDTPTSMPPSDKVPATVVPAEGNIDSLTTIDSIALPPPITPVSNKIVEGLQTPPSASSAADAAPRRGRGRPRKGDERKVVEVEEVAITRKRTPGDYILTPVLLSEPNMAWIHCTICNDPFVQQNAYFTRSSCPRCERHSKLYGYQWPKTEREGPHDKEERILDHRLIHRFLTADDEAKIRGRKLPSSFSVTPIAPVLTVDGAPVKRGRGRPRKYALPAPVPIPDSEDDFEDESDLNNIRRSGRRRHPSQKVSTC